MEIINRDSLIDTLKFMIEVAEGSPEDSYFMTSCEFAQVDPAFHERAHKMGLERAMEAQKEAEETKDNM